MSVIRGNSFVYKRSKPRTRRRREWSASRDRRVAAPSFHLGRTGKRRRLPGSSEPTALSFWMKCSVDQHRLKLIFWLIPFCFAESVFVRECAEPIATQQRFAACVVHGRRSRESIHYATISYGICSGPKWILNANEMCTKCNWESDEEQRPSLD